MVDIHYPRPMPSTIPSSHHCQHSYLPPLFPREGTEPGSRKTSSAGRQLHNDPRHPTVHAEIRHGLRTPPGDMSGVSVNPLLAPNVGEAQYKSVSASVWNGAPRQGSVGPTTNGRYHNKAHLPQNVYHNRSRSHEHTSTNSGLVKETNSKTQNGIDEPSIVSYLQIPSSINESKGSLAEFAAQVCPASYEKGIAANNYV